MNKLCFCIVLLLSFTLSSCSLFSDRKKVDESMIDLMADNPAWENPLLCQTWKITDNASFGGLNAGFRPIRLFSAFHIFPNGSFLYTTADSVFTGKWRKHDDIVYLSFEGMGSDFILSIIKLKAEQFRVLIKTGPLLNDLNMISDGIIHKKTEDDPWYPANNRWRIKPLSAENQSQIKSRVKNYLTFFSLFLRDSKKKNKGGVDWRGIPNIVKIYSNGVSLFKEEKISNAWKNCFFSELQALEGYHYIKDVMYNKKINCVEDAGGWVMLDACFLEGVAAEIK